jgi:hypothetical protein
MSDLNQIQDATMEAISGARNSIQVQFAEHSDPSSLVDSTLMRLCAYFSDRSQVVSYLVSSGFVWDAEIILRSFQEASAKIWFICFSPPGRREVLTQEFWGAVASDHNRKRAHRAAAAADSFNRRNHPAFAAIFSALTRKELFDFGRHNRQTRKTFERKWSFSEIVKFLAANPPAGFDFRDMGPLLHGYGMASHLIHADESALDLMLDRRLRAPEELLKLERAHSCRIYSDLLAIWTFTAIAIAFNFDPKARLGGDLVKRFEFVHAIIEPVMAEFNASQTEFYSKHRPPTP